MILCKTGRRYFRLGFCWGVTQQMGAVRNRVAQLGTTTIQTVDAGCLGLPLTNTVFLKVSYLSGEERRSRAGDAHMGCEDSAGLWLASAGRLGDVATRGGDVERILRSEAAGRDGFDGNVDLLHALSVAGIVAGDAPATPKRDPKSSLMVDGHAVWETVGHLDDGTAS